MRKFQTTGFFSFNFLDRKILNLLQKIFGKMLLYCYNYRFFAGQVIRNAERLTSI